MGLAVGFQVLESNYEYSPRLKHISGIGTYVNENSQRLGIGSKLFEYSIPRIKKLGFEIISSHILETNIKSRHFYGKHGFVERGVLYKYAKFDERYVSEIIIDRRLT